VAVTADVELPSVRLIVPDFPLDFALTTRETKDQWAFLEEW